MRIIAGAYRGTRLKAPTGRDTRPTGDRVREALFSSLHARIGHFEGLRVLDAFAGSGVLGLEALSRGAARVVAVERDRAAAAVVRANVDALHENEHYLLLGGDTFRSVERLAQAGPYDLVLVDPPYATETATIKAWLAQMEAARAFTFGAVVVVEQDTQAAKEPLWEAPFVDLDTKTYGTTALKFAQLRGSI